MGRKTPHAVPQISLTEPTNSEEMDRVETIEMLEDVATLKPGLLLKRSVKNTKK